MIYKTVDLCAGIGGIRKGFEKTEYFKNVLSSEIDKYACETYEHIFGENPYNDLASDEFKEKIRTVEYDVLLAGFPCQTFSRAGKQAGFNDENKGVIFTHIAEIIKNSNPKAFLLENVDHLITHGKGETFRHILETLIIDLGYKIVGAKLSDNGELLFNSKDFIRNSRDFGVPQNRPRAYIIGFKDENSLLNLDEMTLPTGRQSMLYDSFTELMDETVDAKYYMASGYLETLEKHLARQKSKGNGFGYRIINLPPKDKVIANSLLATGGSGKERNLIFDNRFNYSGLLSPNKRTPINNKFVRVMTPNEWGKLQGFVGYGFVDDTGVDLFSFPQDMKDTQKYKQFGNSVTIPVIEEMAKFIFHNLQRII